MRDLHFPIIKSFLHHPVDPLGRMPALKDPITFLSAVIFTIGCFILSANSVLCIMPLIDQHFSHGIIALDYLEASLSIVSCTLFLIGSTVAFVRSFRIHGCFELIEGEVVYGSEKELPWPKAELNTNSSSNLLGTSSRPSTPPPCLTQQSLPVTRKFSFPLACKQLVQHARHDLSLAANWISLVGSMIYTMTSVAALISIHQTGNIALWIRWPQLVGGAGFLISSAILIVHIQRQEFAFGHSSSVWRPAWNHLRWHVNAWNLIGSAGFILCASCGLIEHANWARWSFGVSYLWGSWAFLVGSGIQWYKSVHRRREPPELMEKEKISSV